MKPESARGSAPGPDWRWSRRTGIRQVGEWSPIRRWIRGSGRYQTMQTTMMWLKCTFSWVRNRSILDWKGQQSRGFGLSLGPPARHQTLCKHSFPRQCKQVARLATSEKTHCYFPSKHGAHRVVCVVSETLPGTDKDPSPSKAWVENAKNTHDQHWKRQNTIGKPNEKASWFFRGGGKKKKKKPNTNRIL